MDKVKKLFKRISIKTTFVIYIILCLALSLFLSLASSALCQYGQDQIADKYQSEFNEMGSQGQIILSNGEKVGGTITFFTNNIESLFSEIDLGINNTLDILNMVLVPFWFIFGIGITSVIFYKKILQKPLEILDNAAENISKNNLDFTVTYDRQDEMGKLCISFEKMRAALQQNSFEMWRQIDERKQLNAAFSHDLRTPLTVLKGQSEMLLNYVPAGKLTNDKITASARTMKVHITRLENYVTIMNNLQRLEDIEISRAEIAKSDIILRLKESGKIICSTKEFIFNTDELTENSVNADISVVMQVFENLLANAVRFAKKQVTVKLSSEEAFSITVSDDGNGFTEKDLKEATAPFYKTDIGNSQHFGIGLNICKILCEKHGGYVTLSNQISGAIVKAVF